MQQQAYRGGGNAVAYVDPDDVMVLRTLSSALPTPRIFARPLRARAEKSGVVSPEA